MGAAVLMWWWNTTNRIRASAEWPAVDGEIIHSEIVRDSTRNRGGNYNILHRADVRYRYEVSGRQYESDVFTFGIPHSFDKRADAETEIATYAVGRHVSVRYDPSSPETSCINPGTVPEQFAVLAWMSGAFLVAGLVSIISGSLTLKRAT